MKFPDIHKLYSLFLKFPNIITDSRQAYANSFFFALKGDNFNGNEFAESALKRGCRYAVIDEEEYYKGENYILVKNCLTALQELAKYHRSHFKIPFIAITGSNGKTTTKELIKCILSKKYKVLATAGNLNNHIGVPLTILSVTNEIEIAVIEMGANHLEEIAMLCDIACPDYGLITNIGRAHIGEFGSFEAIVKAKTELYQFIKQRGKKVFLNSADRLLTEKATGMEQITYDSSEKDFCFCQLVDTNPFLKIKHENTIIASQLIGRYNFENIIAAVCVGKYFGVETRKIKEAIETYVPTNNRSQVVRTKKNTLILDAYNANPSSMSAAIENFYDMFPAADDPSSVRKNKNKWLILGDMLELGMYEIQDHKNILQLIADKKFKNVVLVGERFYKAASEMKISFAVQLLFKNSDEVINRIKAQPLSKDPALILIKGSRGMKLEEVVEYL